MVALLPHCLSRPLSAQRRHGRSEASQVQAGGRNAEGLSGRAFAIHLPCNADLPEARRLLRDASHSNRDGSGWAALRYADLCWKGIGGPVDRQEGERVLRKLAEAGFATARDALTKLGIALR